MSRCTTLSSFEVIMARGKAIALTSTKILIYHLDQSIGSFALLKDGQAVAIMSRKSSITRYNYEMEINGNEDHAFLVALVIATQRVSAYLLH